MSIRDATDEALALIVRKARQAQLDQYAATLAAVAQSVRDHQVPAQRQLNMQRGRALMAKQFAEIRTRHGV